MGVRRFAILAAGLALAACAPAGSTGTGTCQVRGDIGVFRPGSATFAFAGDVLPHRLIQSDAAARADHFIPSLAPMAPFLRRADVAVVNLEAPTARNVLPGGRDGADPGTRFDDRIYAGYPQFNAHPTLVSALAELGVDVVQTANNHALDRGPLGVDRTLEAVATAGIRATGTVPRGQSGPWHTTVNVAMSGGRARVALLACTYSVNGLPDPARQALRCYGNAPSVPSLIATLLAEPGVDAVILLPHWGVEYSATPDARQRNLARAAIEAGAAAVVGAHPHVLQPIEQVTAPDGRVGYVAYSLGNFISSQWALPRRTGAVLYLDLRRDAQGRVVAAPPRLLPTRVERYQGSGVTVVPAAFSANGTASIAHAGRILGQGNLITPADLGRSVSGCD